MDISVKAKAAHVALRAGAAFAFIYPAVNAWGDPGSWVGYFPQFVLGAGAAVGLAPEVLLHLFGAVEIIVGLWLLWGRYLFWPATAATVLLLAIVAFNLPQMQVVFRDLSIAAITFALAITHMPKKSVAAGVAKSLGGGVPRF